MIKTGLSQHQESRWHDSWHFKLLKEDEMTAQAPVEESDGVSPGHSLAGEHYK